MSLTQQDELSYWLALNRVSGIGTQKFFKLWQAFPKLQTLFEADEAELLAFNLSRKMIQDIRQPDWAGVERDLAWTQHHSHHIVTWNDDEYSPLLTEIAAAPPVLFVKGDVDVLSKPQLAIVGSRNPSPAGNEMAFEFAQYLSEAGMVVTSGLAMGIDGAAHRGALASQAPTIAVMGHGLNHVYPAKHKDLAEKIIINGAMVSEFVPDAPPKAEHFPRRNRIISGLSMGVLVIEAALRSGSLITARYALEQGREVFAIPGSIHNPLSRGCHSLIRQGAKLVEVAADILEEFSMAGQYPEFDLVHSAKIDLKLAGLDGQHLKLMRYLAYDCTPIDLLVERSGLTADRVSSMLLQLEMDGYVVAVPGGYARTV